MGWLPLADRLGPLKALESAGVVEPALAASAAALAGGGFAVDGVPVDLQMHAKMFSILDA